MSARGVNEPVEVLPADFEFPFNQKTVTIGGKEFVFRELTVAESDSCADAAKEPDGDINGRTMMRLMIAKSSVSPKLTLDTLSKLPGHVYVKFAEVVNDVNGSGPEEEDESPGNV